eukprot:6213804-Pleurochrysis_carterae.AAC.1
MPPLSPLTSSSAGAPPHPYPTPTPCARARGPACGHTRARGTETARAAHGPATLTCARRSHGNCEPLHPGNAPGRQ